MSAFGNNRFAGLEAGLDSDKTGDAPSELDMPLLGNAVSNDVDILVATLRNDGLFRSDDNLTPITLEIYRHEHSGFEKAVFIRNDGAYLHRSGNRIQPRIDAGDRALENPLRVYEALGRYIHPLRQDRQKRLGYSKIELDLADIIERRNYR